MRKKNCLEVVLSKMIHILKRKTGKTRHPSLIDEVA